MHGVVRSIVMIVGMVAPLAAAIDAGSDVVAVWPVKAGDAGLDPKYVQLLRDGGVTAVVLPAALERAAEPFLRACRESGLMAIAQLETVNQVGDARKLASQLRKAGFSGLAVHAEGALSDERSVRAFVDAAQGLDVLVFLKPEQVGWRVKPAQAVLRFGQWPGVRSGPNERGRGLEVASASREPWVDANSYVVGYLRGMFPDRAAWLGYRPDEEAGVAKDRVIGYETLEMALAEAYMAGGNVVLTFPDRYYAGLVSGEEKAQAAWRAFGETARFLKTQVSSFRQPSGATVAVAAGSIEQSGEVLNMMFRRNESPLVFPADSVPDLDPEHLRAVVRANIPPPDPVSLKKLLGYAGAGGLLITAPGAAEERKWWLDPACQKVRADEDRDYYAYRKGHILAYHAPVEDVSEFALDVIDAVGVRERDLRLWNAGSVVGLLSRLGGGNLSVELINYSSGGESGRGRGYRRDNEFPVRVEGVYRKATLLEPGAPAPRSLKVAKRGTGTEIVVDKLNRVAVIVLE